ncbi:hypothetical protein GWI72_07675 [Microvirga tunisiensis]|uniref:Uncharacterized protein n=2 Tax=Pannonibacter tanglangensis TaxID=2750084 RepID=A0A7X5F1Q3_9HYPH|nr:MULTISPECIES: DUF6653 family protein [unclassified Pannonibacter]NBN62486.1 hypothetical protein [Pannonibacter sp. XCT-34]NBN78142.1 hypothetical protein [Pannonibacter sp. XCT-53]
MSNTAAHRTPGPQPRPVRPSVIPASQIRWYSMAARLWRRPPGLGPLAVRLLLLPAVPVALWLHEPLDWQMALLAVTGLLVLVWLLRRGSGPAGGQVLGSRPGWHVRALMGERMFFNRVVVPVPPAVARPAGLLVAGAVAGGLIAALAGFAGSLPVVLAGTGLCLAAQLAYLVLMARLYGQMQDADPLYRAWRRPALNDNTRGARKPGQAA